MKEKKENLRQLEEGWEKKSERGQVGRAKGNKGNEWCCGRCIVVCLTWFAPRLRRTCNTRIEWTGSKESPAITRETFSSLFLFAIFFPSSDSDLLKDKLRDHECIIVMSLIYDFAEIRIEVADGTSLFEEALLPSTSSPSSAIIPPNEPYTFRDRDMRRTVRLIRVRYSI